MIRALRTALFTLSLSVLAVGLLQAQNPLQPKDGEEADLDKVQNKPDPRVDKKRLDELQNGKRAVADEAKENKEVLGKYGRYLAYRLTNSKFHGQADADDKSTIVLTMTDLIREAQLALLLPRSDKKALNDNQKEYAKELSKELVKCLRDVLAHNARPVVRVNAARMLSLVGEAGYEDVADSLVEIIANPRESEATKLWAFRGLKELMEEISFKDPKREARVILTLGEYILRKPDPMPTAAEEIDALRYVRREAVRALGQSQNPMLPKTDKAEGRSTWVLLKVARKDGLTPDPSISEQVEAAIGACTLKAGKDVSLDLVANHVGHVAVEFVNQANRAKTGTGDAGIAWKLYAARLYTALDDLRARAKDGQPAAVTDYVEKLAKQAQDTVRQVWDGKEANPTPLDDWLRANPAKSTTVYRSVAESTIHAGGAAGN